ncbi:MAG: hypothetical protein ABIJ81_00580 [Patescibacteria group bacterium]
MEEENIQMNNDQPVNEPTMESAGPTETSKAGMPNKPRKIGRAIGIIVVVVIIYIFAVQVMAADSYEAVVQVIEGENKIGVNPLTDRLDFGDISRDNGASRFVTLTNEGKMDKFIMVWKSGQIAEIMKVSNNNFVIPGGEDYRLELNVYVPVSAPIGEYQGRVRIFKLPKFW